MQKITTESDLKLAIEQLETQSSLNKLAIQTEMLLVLDNLRPINMIKQTIVDLIHSTEIKVNLTDLILGVTSGAIAKNLLVGETNNPISKISGILVEMLVAKNVTNNAEQIKSIGSSIWNKLIPKLNNN